MNVVQQATSWYEFCGSGAHETKFFEANAKSVNNVGNSQRGGGQTKYGNTYNSSWGYHSFSWGGNQNKKKQAQTTKKTTHKGQDNNTKILSRA